MEQVYNSMLDMLQNMAERQTGASQAAQPDREAGAAFQRLLERHAQAAGREDANPQEAPSDPETPQKTPGRREETALYAAAAQGQLAWASLVLAQPPADIGEGRLQGAAEMPRAPAAILPAVLASEPAAAGDTLPNSALAPEGAAAAPAELSAAPKTTPAPETAGGNALQTGAATGGAPSAETAGPGQSPEPPDHRRYGDITVPDAAGSEHALFQRLEAAPIKVGEAPAEASPQGSPEDVARQLAGGLKNALRRGDAQVKLHLEPASLGSVQVELTKGQDGTLHVLLLAESPQTRGLLERSAAGLQSLLSHAGTQTVQVEVPRQQESQQQSFYDGRGGAGQNGQEQEEHRQQPRRQPQDFLQQLRLGLIPLETEAV